jgi:hypothetical protein
MFTEAVGFGEHHFHGFGEHHFLGVDKSVSTL